MRVALERPGVDYNFSQPIKDRVEESISGIRGQVVVKIYGDDLGLMHQKLDEVKTIIVARAARATSTSTGRAARSTSSRTSIARRPRATACRCATSRTRSRARYGGKLATTMWEGERRVGVRIKTPIAGQGDPASVGRLEIPTRARAPAAGRAGQAAPRQRAHADQPRAGAALPGAQVQHRGARHGQLRRRGAGPRGVAR